VGREKDPQGKDLHWATSIFLSESRGEGGKKENMLQEERGKFLEILSPEISCGEVEKRREGKGQRPHMVASLTLHPVSGSKEWGEGEAWKEEKGSHHRTNIFVSSSKRKKGKKNHDPISSLTSEKEKGKKMKTRKKKGGKREPRPIRLVSSHTCQPGKERGKKKRRRGKGRKEKILALLNPLDDPRNRGGGGRKKLRKGGRDHRDHLPSLRVYSLIGKEGEKRRGRPPIIFCAHIKEEKKRKKGADSEWAGPTSIFSLSLQQGEGRKNFGRGGKERRERGRWLFSLLICRRNRASGGEGGKGRIGQKKKKREKKGRSAALVALVFIPPLQPAGGEQQGGGKEGGKRVLPEEGKKK